LSSKEIVVPFELDAQQPKINSKQTWTEMRVIFTLCSNPSCNF
jgi:hypothetical protein